MLEQYFSKMSWSEIGIPEGIPLFCFLWHLAISFGLVHFDPCFILPSSTISGIQRGK